MNKSRLAGDFICGGGMGEVLPDVREARSIFKPGFATFASEAEPHYCS